MRIKLYCLGLYWKYTSWFNFERKTINFCLIFVTLCLCSGCFVPAGEHEEV